MKKWSSDFPDTLKSTSNSRYPPHARRERLLADEIYLPPAPYDPHAGSVRVLLVYPNTYHVGMSNLGFLYLYRLLNEHPDIACERAFYEEGLSHLSFESGSDIGKFDVILFTLPFEMDVLNILRFLAENGIPAMASGRQDRSWPLVVIGGAAPSLNPRFTLPFADAVFSGDVEPALDCLVAAIVSIQKTPRDRVILELEDIPGIVTARRAAQNTPISRPEISGPRGCFNTVATPNTEFARSLLVEIERGCPFKCRFCTVGYERKRITELAPDEIARLVGQAETFHLRFGMVGSALLSSKIWKTDRHIWDESSVDFTFASLRVDKLHSGNLKSLARFQRSMTLAPEVGTPRMMKLINKRMDLEAARERLKLARAEGVSQVKLYFIYGFPFETAADLEGILDFCAAAVKTGLRVRVSLNPFIPKPQTPLQWFPMQPLKILKSKFCRLRDCLRALGVRDVSGYSPREAVQQAFIVHAWESDVPAILSMAQGKSGVDVRPRLENFNAVSDEFLQPLPWDILQTSLTKGELWEEARAIQSEIQSEAG